MKILMALTLLFSSALSAHAALQSKMIEYIHHGTTMEGYLVYDDSIGGKRPGVLVVHEWKGLNDYAKRRADMLAQEGYVAFAPDIYGKGVRPVTAQEAGAEAGKYKNDRSLLRHRVQAGLDVLKSQELVESDNIAAIGYCFGGTAVLELARSGVDIDGVVSFHGGLSSPTPEDAKNIKANVLVLHGADDPFVPAEEVETFKKEMEDADVDYQFVSYPGAVHGFTNPDNNGAMKGALYDADADEQSWEEMKEFFTTIFSDSVASSD